MAVIAYLSIIFQNGSVSETSVDNILQSTDINEKINFLIERENNKYSNDAKIIPIIMTIALSLMIFRDNIVKFTLYFCPTNLFLFGKEIDRYKKRLDIRSKLFWIIIIGLIISIAGSFIVQKIQL